MDAWLLLDRIDEVRQTRPVVLVGIGGRGCSGKTTLARQVEGAQIVGTDEFWNGKSFDLARLLAEVIRPLGRREVARYRAFSWANQTLEREVRIVRPEGVIVIEGVCALHRMMRDRYDLRVWVDAPRDIRLARATARDGDESRRVWQEVWMPREEAYIQRDDPQADVDLTLQNP